MEEFCRLRSCGLPLSHFDLISTAFRVPLVARSIHETICHWATTRFTQRGPIQIPGIHLRNQHTERHAGGCERLGRGSRDSSVIHRTSDTSHIAEILVSDPVAVSVG